MINFKNQIHLCDIYEEVVDCFQEDKPKYFGSLLTIGKAIKKKDSNIIPHKVACSKILKQTYANPEIKLSYINGHYCYALKATTLPLILLIIKFHSFSA